jgi:glycerate kinase
MASPVPSRALLACGAFSASLRAHAVANAIARGLRAGGAEDPEIFVLERSPVGGVGDALEQLGFDERMRAARAVVIAVASLDPRTIARSAAFDVATRARQAGVPAYAIARESRLSSFDARVLDLQLVLVAQTPRALAAAGRRVAEVL